MIVIVFAASFAALFASAAVIGPGWPPFIIAAMTGALVIAQWSRMHDADKRRVLHDMAMQDWRRAFGPDRATWPDKVYSHGEVIIRPPHRGRESWLGDMSMPETWIVNPSLSPTRRAAVVAEIEKRGGTAE